MWGRNARDMGEGGRRIWEFGVSSFVLLLSVPPAAAAKAWRQVAAVGVVSVCRFTLARGKLLARSRSHPSSSDLSATSNGFLRKTVGSYGFFTRCHLD
jgi:hypothetical protein